jgi:two-component system, chemotaxis family, protein-glutamate methylesterase/glutaminase
MGERGTSRKPGERVRSDPTGSKRSSEGQADGSRAPGAFDIVAIASSAGGPQALQRLLSAIHPPFPAAIVIVQHLDPRHRSLIASLLNRRTDLEVNEAVDGEHLLPEAVYVAPPNRHLLVNTDGTVSLTQTELVHFLRPSADLLFESVAAAYKRRAIAVVLTGTGTDGAMGVEAVKKMEGTVIAQDKDTSEFYGMPSAAIATGRVDFVLALDEIAPALTMLVTAGETV